MLGKYVTIVNPRGCVVVIDARDTRTEIARMQPNRTDSLSH